MNHVSLGVFLNVFTKDTQEWKQQMDFINGLGNIDHIEVLLEETNLSDQEITYLQELLKGYTVIIHAPFMDLALLSPHEEIVQATMHVFSKAIHIGTLLNAQLLTLHMERYPNFWSKKKAEEETLFYIEQLAKESTFPLAIENLSAGGKTQIPYPTTPQQIVDLAKKLPANTGLTIDIGHLLKDEHEVFTLLGQTMPYVYNMHLHDGYKGAAHLSLGKGKLDREKYFSLIKNIHYKNFITLEVLGQDNIKASWEIIKKYSQKNQ